MIIKQFEIGRLNVFAYLIGDEETKEGLFVDPADESDRLLREADSFGLNVKYIVNTHSHIDHVMGNKEMVKRTGAKIVIHEADAIGLLNPPPEILHMFNAEASPPADILVKDGDLVQAGKVKIRVIHTPGHSPGGICLYVDGMVFTGDTLFVGAIGRTDFPGCSYEALEKSIREKLYALPGETIVFPGHNYGMSPTSTIQQERQFNAFVRG